ncbi:MAG: hypothetical protein EA368_12405 [Leptolyngbya sp. DLM2.Bin27]|nr:MAG: hypothetical protein EA368_12405 [Leptolyngbya sp. DLM2.Bin27]
MLAQLLAMDQTQCQQQLTAYEEFQQFWRECYVHYSKVAQGGSGEPEGRQLDANIARLAASDAESVDDVVGILRQGPTALALRLNQGHYAALEYCQDIVQQLTQGQSDPGLQLTKKALEIEL